jgi:hypothetical protein
MTSVNGQASVEYAGLLALAAVLGAALALIAGPPLINAVRDALVSAFSGSPRRAEPVTASAADIADVQSALLAGDQALTPDAALLALALRHGRTRSAEVAKALLLAAVREAAPWIGETRTYQAWVRLADGPYEPSATADGDRDVEHPTAAPEVMWVTVAAQRRALANALAHHMSPTALALDAFSLIPFARVLRSASSEARAATRTARMPWQTADGADAGSGVIDLVDTHDADIPAGMRAGDVVVSWPVHRTFWRDGHDDPAPLVDLGTGLGRHPPARDYQHVVFLRPGVRGLAIVAQGLGA